MKKLIGAFAGVAALASVGFSAPAFAVVMQATYTGSVYDFTDLTGVFGFDTGSAIITGQTYSLKYVYDPSTVGTDHETTPSVNQVIGGSFYSPFVGPMQSAELTINSHTVTVKGDYISSVYTSRQDDPSRLIISIIQHLVRDLSNDGITDLQRDLSGAVTAYSLVIPYGLETPFTLDFVSNPIVNVDSLGQGSFRFSSKNIATGDFNYFTEGWFKASRLVVEYAPPSPPPPEVPIPAALPLFAAGLGAMGYMGWRRRKVAVAG